jgi:NurA-like 5'-3' nuclease
MLFEDFEMLVISAIQDELEGYKLELGDLPTTAANKREAMEKEKAVYISELNKKQAMLDKASEMLEIGVYSVEKYLERESILRKDMDALQANLDALSDTSELDEIDRLENAVPIIEKALDEYWSLSPQAQNDILKSFVDKIIYTKTIANHKHHSGRDDASVEIFLKI